MGIIKELAPSLYEAIIAANPVGTEFYHIKRNDTLGATNISVAPSKKDGLPVINVGSQALQNRSQEQLRFTIAHELGHFALGHLFKQPTLEHKVLHKVAAEEFKKGKKVGGLLPFEKTFEHAFTRAQEFEADRFAIIEFGIPIEDAISAKKRWIAESEEHKLEAPEKETFKSTHPLSIARIQQFEDLRREVELNKARGRKPTPINWKKLAAQYLKEAQEAKK
jgi:hypothetical protein